ncbi:PIP5K4 [Symbiodinium sp. CCMP2592]|nr:PIP5K4 [Symbiodinium sp. CCMP2592]
MQISLDSLTSFQMADALVVMSLARNILLPLQPMSYAAALRHLRHVITLPWKNSQRPEVSQIEKSCQCHHRLSSSQLYSRDDIVPSLRAQMKIQHAVRSGARFMTPLHRGAQSPMDEPEVHLENFSKEVGPCNWHYFRHFSLRSGNRLPFVDLPSHESFQPEKQKQEPSFVLRDIQSSDEESGDSSGDEGPSLGPADEFLFGALTNIQHVLVRASASKGIPYEGAFVRPACGVPLPADSIRISSDFNPKLQLCKRRACCIAYGQLKQ